LSALTNRRKINFGVGIRRVETARNPKALANEDEVALSSIELTLAHSFGVSLHKCAMVEENLNKACVVPAADAERSNCVDELRFPPMNSHGYLLHCLLYRF